MAFQHLLRFYWQSCIIIFFFQKFDQSAVIATKVRITEGFCITPNLEGTKILMSDDSDVEDTLSPARKCLEEAALFLEQTRELFPLSDQDHGEISKPEPIPRKRKQKMSSAVDSGNDDDEDYVPSEKWVKRKNKRITRSSTNTTTNVEQRTRNGKITLAFL
jgi:hypothetical protein